MASNNRIASLDADSCLPLNKKISLGPFNDAAILKMAAITKDYNPVRIFTQSAQESGYAYRPLHFLWISSLVDAGLADLTPSWQIAEMEINYEKVVFENNSITLKFEGYSLSSDGARVLFTIKDENKRNIAHGSAIIIPHNASEVRQWLND